MRSTLAREWRVLRRTPPGRRFQASYELSRAQPDRSTLVSRIIRLALAAVALVMGVALIFLPGPAFVFFAIAGALLAAESRTVARLLDWSEVKIRRVLRSVWRRWCALSLPGKVLAASLAGLALAGATYAAYHVWVG